MKCPLRAGSILAVLAASILGCDPNEPASDGPAKPVEYKPNTLGPASDPPPVDPSRTPSLPSTNKAERDAQSKKDDDMAREKDKAKAEAKPAGAKDEPKLESPR